MKSIILLPVLFVTLIFLISMNASAAKKTHLVNTQSKKGEALKLSKSINFEERRVEAVNTRPLDSFQHVAEKKDDGKSRLYDKPMSFQGKNKLLIKSIGSH